MVRAEIDLGRRCLVIARLGLSDVDFLVLPFAFFLCISGPYLDRRGRSHARAWQAGRAHSGLALLDRSNSFRVFHPGTMNAKRVAPSKLVLHANRFLCCNGRSLNHRRPVTKDFGEIESLLSQEITAAINQLLSEKHLYQSVEVSLSSIQAYIGEKMEAKPQAKVVILKELAEIKERATQAAWGLHATARHLGTSSNERIAGSALFQVAHDPHRLLE